MSYSQDILDELHALKRDAGHVLRTSAEDWQQISRQKAHALAAETKSLVTTLRDALAEDEAAIEQALAGRVMTALATALALGVVVGYFLRTKP